MRSFLEANPKGFADRKFSEAAHSRLFREVASLRATKRTAGDRRAFRKKERAKSRSEAERQASDFAERIGISVVSRSRRRSEIRAEIKFNSLM